MALVANGLAKLLEECGELSQIAAKNLSHFSAESVNYPLMLRAFDF